MEQNPPRESIEKCTHRRYIKKNARVQKQLAELGIASKTTENADQEDDYEDDYEDEDESLSELDEHAEQQGEALAQAERSAAARPGVSGRLKEAIEKIIAKGCVQFKLNSLKEHDTDDHFEGEPASNGRVWRHINGRWVTGVQESTSVFAPDAKTEECKTEHEITLEQFQKELTEDPDENTAIHLNRSIEVEHNDQQAPVSANHSRTGCWKPLWRQPPIPESSDDEPTEARGPASFGERVRSAVTTVKPLCSSSTHWPPSRVSLMVTETNRRKMLPAPHRMTASSLEMIYLTDSCLPYFKYFNFLYKCKLYEICIHIVTRLYV